MDLTTITAISDAAREKQIVGENILRAINALAAIAWRTPVTFYAQLGTQAAAEAAKHAKLIEALKAVAPELVAKVVWPPYEVIYLADGSAIPTTIPFNPTRERLTAAGPQTAADLEAGILAEIAAFTQPPTE